MFSRLAPPPILSRSPFSSKKMDLAGYRPYDLLCRCRIHDRASTSPATATNTAQKTFRTCSFFPNASMAASTSACIAHRSTFGRKTKSGRKTTPAPITASAGSVLPASRYLRVRQTGRQGLLPSPPLQTRSSAVLRHSSLSRPR